MNKFTKRTLALGAAATVLASAGIAYAYWTTSGSGAGTATVAPSNGTLALHAAAVANIVPRTAGYSVPIMADNAGTTDLRVNTVHTVISSTNLACQALIDSGNSGLSMADVNTSATNVAHGASNVVIGTGTLLFANDPVNSQDDCKSAPLDLTFTTV